MLECVGFICSNRRTKRERESAIEEECFLNIFMSNTMKKFFTERESCRWSQEDLLVLGRVAGKKEV